MKAEDAVKVEQAQADRVAAGEAFQSMWGGAPGQAFRDLLERIKVTHAISIVNADHRADSHWLAWERGYYAGLVRVEQEVERSIKAYLADKDAKAKELVEKTVEGEQARREFMGGKPIGPKL